MAIVSDKQTQVFTTEDLRRRAENSLVPPQARIAEQHIVSHGSSDFELDPGLEELVDATQEKRQAAVLVPVVARESGATVLFTKRAESLPTHAGQISFPGGKMDQSDADVMATAFREAREEVGLDPDFIDPVGFLDDYATSTGFRVAPLVAVIREGFAIRPDHGEVDDVFEVPLAFLMNSANHQLHTREWHGAQRLFYAIPYQDRFIWGATAGMLRNLYERLYSADARR